MLAGGRRGSLNEMGGDIGYVNGLRFGIRRVLGQASGGAGAAVDMGSSPRVRVNHDASPRYLSGVHGVVVEFDQHAAIVRVHRPSGCVESSEIRCRPMVSSISSIDPPDDHQ